jgi:hypothetical protein
VALYIDFKLRKEEALFRVQPESKSKSKSPVTRRGWKHRARMITMQKNTLLNSTEDLTLESPTLIRDHEHRLPRLPRLPP